MPLQVRICVHLADPFLADLCGKLRTKADPPETDRFMADVDAAFVQKILHVTKRKRKPDVHHHRQADHLRAGFEVAKWAAFCHPQMLRNRPTLFKSASSNSAYWTLLMRDTHLNPPQSLQDVDAAIDQLLLPNPSGVCRSRSRTTDDGLLIYGIRFPRQISDCLLRSYKLTRPATIFSHSCTARTA